MSHLKPKYVEPSVPQRLMAGKGSARPSVFGVIGKTKTDTYTKSLGGLVTDTKVNHYKDPSFKASAGMNTEYGILGPNATKISGHHFGQVPYEGRFMARLGPKA